AQPAARRRPRDHEHAQGPGRSWREVLAGRRAHGSILACMRQHAGDVAGTGADVSDGRTAPGADRGPRVDARATTVAVGVPLLVAAAVLGTDLWLGDRLGDTVAIHWDGAGRPDGY